MNIFEKMFGKKIGGVSNESVPPEEKQADKHTLDENIERYKATVSSEEREELEKPTITEIEETDDDKKEAA